jgi:hypothetical protein
MDRAELIRQIMAAAFEDELEKIAQGGKALGLFARKKKGLASSVAKPTWFSRGDQFKKKPKGRFGHGAIDSVRGGGSDMARTGQDLGGKANPKLRVGPRGTSTMASRIGKPEQVLNY